jgi:hypothetical protein
MCVGRRGCVLGETYHSSSGLRLGRQFAGTPVQKKETLLVLGPGAELSR